MLLHLVLNYYSEGKRELIKSALKRKGFADKEYFYIVAQAISETLPNDSKEKRLIDGFLAGKESYKKDEEKINIEQLRFES